MIDTIERCPLKHGAAPCYVVRSTSGQILGHHKTRTAAKRQVRAIQLAKLRKEGRLPRRRKTRKGRR